MTPDELLSLADNPNHIPGIYNYCDRWCERCYMTAHCLLFETTPKEEDQASGGGFSESFFQTMHNSFTLTMELLQKIADEKGIDLTMTPEEDAAYTTKWSTMHQTVEAAPLTRQAKRYMKACHEWLETSGSMMSQKQEELKSAARMDLPDQHPLEDAILLKDALEVISWYHFQIVTKLMRAQSGRFEDEVEAEDVDFPKDSDGSAKVALIGIDRSIAAWGLLLNQLPDQEETVLSKLSMLERLRRMTEHFFPDARNFKRPGFDE